MVVDVAIHGVGEVKLLCSLHEVMVTSEVVISYVKNLNASEHQEIKHNKYLLEIEIAAVVFSFFIFSRISHSATL